MGTEIFQYDMPKHIPELQVFGRGFWVKRFEQWYEQNKNLDVVICDVRFQHEADAILKMGGQVWKVQRPSLVSVDEHASEMEMDSITGVTNILQNDGTLENLYNKIDSLVLVNEIV
jgi:tRNA A-37 threonylcarbamoyl transferase component Bud32